MIKKINEKRLLKYFQQKYLEMLFLEHKARTCGNKKALLLFLNDKACLKEIVIDLLGEDSLISLEKSYWNNINCIKVSDKNQIWYH